MNLKFSFVFIFASLFLLNICSGQNPGNNEPDPKKYISDEIIVKFSGSTAAKAIELTCNELGATDIRSGYGGHYHVLKIKDGTVEETLKRCKKNKEIEYAEPNHIYYINMVPNDEFYAFQWHLHMVNLEEAWEESTGDGITIALIDTGVDPDGIDGFGSRLIRGMDFINRINHSRDDNGHGTHLAGTLAQETNNGTGVSGVAPDATILAIKAFDKNGSSRTDNVVDSVRWAVENGARVINLSFGGAPFNETFETAINEGIEQGVVFVAAAGNGSQPQITFPAAYEGVISVGAVQQDKKLAPYSNHGPDLDVVAPGGNVFKDQNNDNNADGILQETLFTDILKSTNPIRNYYFLDGTSMAAPHVSGVIALLMSKYPRLGPSIIRRIIRSSADDLGEPGRDDTFGWGLVNASNALRFLENR